MKHIYDLDKLTFITEDETEVYKEFMKKLKGQRKGDVDNAKMKQTNGGMAIISKMVQTRTANALMFANLGKVNPSILTKVILKEVENKPKKIKGKR